MLRFLACVMSLNLSSFNYLEDPCYIKSPGLSREQNENMNFFYNKDNTGKTGQNSDVLNSMCEEIFFPAILLRAGNTMNKESSITRNHQLRDIEEGFFLQVKKTYPIGEKYDRKPKKNNSFERDIMKHELLVLLRSCLRRPSRGGANFSLILRESLLKKQAFWSRWLGTCFPGPSWVADAVRFLKKVGQKLLFNFRGAAAEEPR